MSELLSSLRFLTPKPLRPDDPLFIFLPGMDGTGQLLKRQLDGLSQHFDIRCLSIPATDLSDWEHLTASVVTLIQKEQRQRPIYLCGESFGGCLALRVAAAAPELFDRLVLINSATAFSRLPWMRLASSAAKFLPSPLYTLSASGLIPFLIAWDRVESSDRIDLLNAMQSVESHSATWRLNLLRQFDLLQLPLSTLMIPTLIITGAKDRLLPSMTEGQRLVGCLPKAQVTVLENSGHACLLEKEVNLYEILSQQGFLTCRWQELGEELSS
ncbi:Putative aminoacrylate hydrolase RutD [Acaryochloris thomasi RCC1774]|uniref:Aminoacrylate hydrolase RutD n=1 Tax=Acaryochloris thomasi RCC1774 TaxID=1764569 RepID=A0A2W1JH97_9CYAN|nr:alpha/beta hydrolase [Acaryochloris thomasi]PZD70965.1 Putative aminoacrylate hydrolase RutD [Acaryochloris thomasi RCC1774]